MNRLANAMLNEENKTFTENGAPALRSTGNACVNLYSVIGALRHGDKIDTDRAIRLFSEAYNEDPLVATKILFYARDVREGLGEREVFRQLVKYAATYHPEAIRVNIDLIGAYGRYDDLYSFIGTPLEKDMWAAMKQQFEEDRENLEKGNAISLLAKWIKTPDGSQASTRRLGITTALKLGYDVRTFKRILRDMRRRINIVESYMSKNQWDKIRYAEVPSRAMMIYRKAFGRHDGDRFTEYIQQALKGEIKINSSTLYPYDIVEKYMYRRDDHAALEAQWRQLPNYVKDDNILVMADVSESMNGRPMASSVGLAIYFAERNRGDFHNMFMTFSSNPAIVKIKGDTLRSKINSVLDRGNVGYSTNLRAAFESLLDIATKNHISQEDMPKAIVVITDMEIDSHCIKSDWLFYDHMAARFAQCGYTIPNVVFWNVNSRHDVFQNDSKRNGVQLVSGQSASTFKNLVECLDMTPEEAMLKVINSERYSQITIAEA